MKIALLYSGHLRSLEKTYKIHLDLINELKKENEVKVFCQTWDEPESTTKSWWDKEVISLNYSYNPSEVLAKTINPQRIKISNKTEFPEPPIFFNSSVTYEGIASMFFAIQESYKLYEDYYLNANWKADILIRIRYDIVFSGRTLVKYLNNVLLEGKMLVFYSKSYDFFDSYTDTFLILPNSVKFNIFFNVYHEFVDLTKLRSYFAKYNRFIPELFISEFIFLDHSYIKLFQYLYILRINGDRVLVSDKISNSDNTDVVKSIRFSQLTYYINKQDYFNQLKLFLGRNKMLKYYKYFTCTLSYFDIANIFINLIFNINKKKEVFLIVNYSIKNCFQNKSRLFLLKVLRKICAYS